MRKPKTFSRTVRNAVLRAVLFTACLGSSYVLVASTTATAEAEQREAPSYLSTLIDLHDCWTGAQPALTDTPEHVIITEDGASRPIHSARVMDALDQIAHDTPSLGWGPGKDHGITVHAVCV